MTAEHSSMVIVTRKSAFSPDFARRAIHMAQKNEWDIVAVHVGSPLSNLAQPHKSRYCSVYASSCEEGDRKVASDAVADGVGFAHTVRFGGTDAAVRSVCSEHGSVKCVLVDQEV